MAQTFRDFIVECELYPYSQECFNIMKECSELKLQEKYLENARFVAASANMYTEANGFHLSEGYFQESVDDTFLEDVEADANKKKVGLIGKIINAVKWLLGKIAKFFNFIGGKLQKLSEKLDPLLEKVRAFDITKENAEALRDAIWDNATRKWNSTGLPFVNNLKFKYKDVTGEVRSAIDYYCCILFGGDGVFIKPGDTTGPINLADFNGMLRGDDLVNIADHFLGSISTGADTASLQAKITEKAKTIQEKGLKIESAEKITKISTALEEINNKLNDQIAIYQKKAADDVQLGGIDADNIKAMQDALNALTNSVGATQKFYAALASFKSTAAKNLNAFIDGQNAKAADEEKIADQNQPDAEKSAEESK